ncbi:MAG: hypothetical protein K2W99_06740 [Chthoniobacterales bacterium]|nr:hypothetical protein [Chthoniobacterales bacterium]
MKLHLRFRFFAFLLGGILFFGSSQNMLADAENNSIDRQPGVDFFVPLDSLPDFSDFHQVAFQYITGFDRVLALFSKPSFYNVPDVVGEALSDHLTTWSEFAQCLNSAGTLYSSSNPDVTQHNLWTSEMEPYITRKVVSRQIQGSPFSTKVFSYHVVSGHGNEPAALSPATAMRYVNWRNVHYWLYHQLQREEAVFNQQQIEQEREDRLTIYFKQKCIYPAIDVIQSIDHIDEILNQSTEIGCYWFSANGLSVESIDPQAAFFLPTTAQKESWDVGYAAQLGLEGGVSWTAESVNNSDASTQTGAVQLGVNKDIMMQEKDAAAVEMHLQQTVQAMQQNFIFLKSSASYQQANDIEKARLETVFWNVVGGLSMIVGVGDMVAAWKGAGEVRFLGSYSDCPFGCPPVDNIISRGGFSAEDCAAANKIISEGRYNQPGVLNEKQIKMIVSRGHLEKEPPLSQVPYGESQGNSPPDITTSLLTITDQQYNALAGVHRSKFNYQWRSGVCETIISLFCFHFGNSSNIDGNY